MTDLSTSVQIKVTAEYLPDRAPDEDKYAFAYHVQIHNTGRQSVQLLNRYWLITDGNGKTTEVRGPGVIGEQPVIAAGKKYQYTSGAILQTPVGTMQGYYEMQDANDTPFQAPIEVFTLAVPNLVN